MFRNSFQVEAVNKKAGPFDLLLCVGEFFGPDQTENEKVRNGSIKSPLDTYVLGPCSSETSRYFGGTTTEELNENMTYLGKRKSGIDSLILARAKCFIKASHSCTKRFMIKTSLLCEALHKEPHSCWKRLIKTSLLGEALDKITFHFYTKRCS